MTLLAQLRGTETMIRSRAIPARLALTLSALLVGGCGVWPIEIGDGSSNTLNVVNNSGETVQVVYLPDVGREFVLIKRWIDPGGSASTVEGLGCTAGTLVARNEAGEDVDQRDEPLCQGETWRIGGDNGAPPS
jgi:hypothetical protein